MRFRTPEVRKSVVSKTEIVLKTENKPIPYTKSFPDLKLPSKQVDILHTGRVGITLMLTLMHQLNFLNSNQYIVLLLHLFSLVQRKDLTVCPGSNDPPKKIFDIFAAENEVSPIY